LSWLLLSGRCAFCKNPISPRYIIVEAVNALMWALLFYLFPYSVLFITSAFLFTILLIIFMIDIDHMIIPDSLNVAILILGLSTTIS
jgi:leader peptidase (prepilin peptidase)/N-methyltransferase